MNGTTDDVYRLQRLPATLMAALTAPRPAGRHIIVTTAIFAVAALVAITWTFVVEAPNPDMLPSNAAIAALPLEKPSVRMPAAAVLLYRSRPSGDRYLESLGQALSDFSEDRFAQAAARLEALGRRYPRQMEPPFYLGVTFLLLGQADAALPAFDDARRLTDQTFRDDILWYRAIALQRLDRHEESLQELLSLCDATGPYRQRACEFLPQPGRN